MATDNRVKIVYFLNSTVRGGVEEHLMLLVRNLDRGRFEAVVACPGMLAEKLRPDVEGAGARIAPFDIRSFARVAEMARLFLFLRRERPAIVHSHLSFASRVSHFVSKLAGVPVTVETAHIREAWRKGPIKTLYSVDRFFALFTDRFLAVSAAVRDYLVNVKGIPASKVTVVTNGIDMDEFRPAASDVLGGAGGAGVARGARLRMGLRPDVPVVSVIARLEPQKGHAYFLEAARMIRERHRDTVFLIVGDGSLSEDLRTLAGSLGIEERCVFTGYMDDVRDALQASTVVVLPSLWEGMPLTAIEASAMGRPVVATSVDGSPEVVRDGHTGILVPPADPAAIAKAVTSLMDDPAMAESMGAAGAEHVRARFDARRQALETQDVYDDILNVIPAGRVAWR